jgi:hypothetical protein
MMLDEILNEVKPQLGHTQSNINQITKNSVQTNAATILVYVGLC